VKGGKERKCACYIAACFRGINLSLISINLLNKKDTVNERTVSVGTLKAVNNMFSRLEIVKGVFDNSVTIVMYGVNHL